MQDKKDNHLHGEEKRMGKLRMDARCAGVELHNIPLCDECEQQDRREESNILSNKHFDRIRNSADTTRKTDLVFFQESVPKRLARRARIKGATGFESELERFINRSSGGYDNLTGPNVRC